MSSTEQASDSPDPRSRWLHSLPAFIGFALGSVYALGAVSVFGQLYAANVSPSQMLELVPLEQMLAQGIGSLITPAAYLVFLLLLLYSLFFIFEFLVLKEEKDSDQEDSQTPFHKHPVRSFERFDRAVNKKWVIIIALCLTAFTVPPLMLITVALTLVSGFSLGLLVGRHYDWTHDDDWHKFFVFWMVSVVLFGSAIASFLQANPLPNATVRLRNGDCVKGGLVLDRGDALYIKMADNQVSAIPARNIQESKIDFLDLPIERSVLDYLLDRNPSARGSDAQRSTDGPRDMPSGC